MSTCFEDLGVDLLSDNLFMTLTKSSSNLLSFSFWQYLSIALTSSSSLGVKDTFMVGD